MSTKQTTTGFIMIDALVGVTIAAILATAFLSALYQAKLASTHNTMQLHASLASLETYEVLVSLAQTNFSAISGASCTNIAPCSVSHDGVSWSINSNTVETIGGHFNRSFTLTNVARDAAGNIVESGGAVDPNTQAAIITITWDERGITRTNVVTAYVHHFNT